MDFADENPIITRLKEYIDNTGLSSTQFADRAGIPRPTFSQLLSGRNKTINNQVLAKLNDNFPDLDILWLLFGRTAGGKAANLQTSEPQISQESANVSSRVADNEAGNASATAADTADDSRRNRSENVSTAEDAFVPYGFTAREEEPAKYYRADEIPVPSAHTHKTIKQIVILYTDNSFEVYDQQ